jgi:hemolysin activation/secretion protein
MLILGICIFWAVPLNAQPEARRPADRPLELPDFAPPQADTGQVLPPIQIPKTPDPRGLSGGRRIFIRGYRIVGNTVFSDSALLSLTRQYAGKEVTLAELEALRDRLTLKYINAGYITSGVVIPEQTISEGILEFRVVEGVLDRVRVSTDGRFRKRRIEDRIRLGLPAILNVKELESNLQILQQDPRIQSVHARLLPAEQKGRAVLEVVVNEARPFWFQAALDNHHAPTIGSEMASGSIGLRNITGYGDTMVASYGQSRGLRDFDMSYLFPLSARESTLGFHIETSRSEVTEAPFDTFDIESRSETYGLDLRHPIFRSVKSQFHLFLTGELRRSKSFVLGSGFSFSPGPEEGESKISVLRFGQEWTYRSRSQVVAARSTFSLGVDMLDATINAGDVPDGQFFAWLGQVQWAYRMPLFGPFPTQVILRADVQLADSPLLGMEQFAIGGHNTVRGYHENTLVRDNGAIGSIEFRVPVYQGHGALVELAPFFDYGYGWQSQRETIGPWDICSAGVGFRIGLKNHVRMEAYWGKAFRDLQNPTDDYNLQDDGIHFRMEVNY